MPILLRFRETYPLMRLVSWDDPGSDRPLNLPEVVVRHLSTQPEFRQCQPLSDTWFTDQLEQGRCLVMLDGLDEVPSTQRPAVRRWVDQQMKRYPATQFLLTSRPHGFELKPDDPSPAIAVDLKLRVLDFTPTKSRPLWSGGTAPWSGA
jgi:predicted NACHT family NTPase